VFALASVLVVASACGGADEVPPNPADDSRVLTLASFVRLCGASADRIAEATASLPEIDERAPIADRLAATANDLDQTSAQSTEALERLHPADDAARAAQRDSLEIYARCRVLAASTKELAGEATQIDDATLNDRTAALVEEANVLSQDIEAFASAVPRPGG